MQGQELAIQKPTSAPPSNRVVVISSLNTRQEVLKDPARNVVQKLDKQCKALFQELYHKIGANAELPEIRFRDGNPIGETVLRRDAYFADLYKTMYLKNAIVPGDIPFEIILEAFTLHAVQNSHLRKGNNQAAIVRQFNEWIVNSSVQQGLRSEFYVRYPEKQPLKLEDPKDKSIELAELNVEELQERISKLKPFRFLEMTQKIIKKYEVELESRGETVDGMEVSNNA